MRLVVPFLLVGCAGELPPVPPELPTHGTPNVVVIVSDDAGYADFSMHGGTDVPTPRIDSLAADGVRFTQGYVTASVCSPSRAALLTGRYQQRYGVEDNPGRNFREGVGLPRSEVTLAEHLRDAGYATLGYGKWHLGAHEDLHPTAQGFETWYGFRWGQRSHWPLADGDQPDRLEWGTEPVLHEDFEWLSTHLAETAVDDLRVEVEDRPVFVYLSLPAVHMPLHPLRSDLREVADSVDDEVRRDMLGMLYGMDRAVGILLDGLEELGIAEQTLVFFVNDNGGGKQNHSSNLPLRGLKGFPYEGGHRVPFLLRWPGVVEPGSVFDDPISSLDVLPTALTAAEVPLPGALDGVDLRPWLTGEETGRPHETLYWRLVLSWAIRDHDLKLVSDRGAPPELFDLAVDPSEEDDLIEARADDAARLRAMWESWEDEVTR